MKESKFVYVRREWLAVAAGSKKPKVCAALIGAILAYAQGNPAPELPANIQQYFVREICPEIDRQREAWRQYDRRKAQFNEVIAGVPDNVRQRYEMEFLTNAYEDEADFLAYLDEVRSYLEQEANHNEQ